MKFFSKIMVVAFSVGIIFPFSRVWAEGSGQTSGEFYVNPGLAIMNPSYYKNSFSLDAGYLKKIHEIAAIGLETGYIFGAKFEGTLGGSYVGNPNGLSFTSDSSVKIFHLSPEIKVGPTFEFQGLKINPFIIGGGGFYWSHLNSGTVTFSNNTTAALGSSDAYNGGWNIGGGVSVFLPGNWSVGFDVRRHDVVYKGSSDETWVTPAFRLALLFS